MTAAHGENWIAKEVYRRELLNMQFTTPPEKQDQNYRIVEEWLKQRIKELDDICNKKAG